LKETSRRPAYTHKFTTLNYLFEDKAKLSMSEGRDRSRSRSRERSAPAPDSDSEAGKLFIGNLSFDVRMNLIETNKNTDLSERGKVFI